MKYNIIYVLRKMLGIKLYLYLFSIITIRRLKTYPFGDEFQHFLNLIPEKGTILDIGANIGLTIVPISQKRPESIILGFEPVPVNILTLERVLKHFRVKNAKIFKTALGDKSGTLEMTVPIVQNVVMPGLSHVYKNDEVPGQKSGQIFSVDVATLDNIPEVLAADKITAIKIDVENFEYHVLKGGENMIRKHRPIIYSELWDNEVRTLTMDFLKDIGYEIKIFDGEKLICFTTQNEYCNFFFLPSGDPAVAN